MNKKLPVQVASLIFLLVGILHVWRFVMNMPVTAGNFTVPMNASLVGGAVAFVMAVWLWSSLK